MPSQTEGCFAWRVPPVRGYTQNTLVLVTENISTAPSYFPVLVSAISSAGEEAAGGLHKGTFTPLSQGKPSSLYRATQAWASKITGANPQQPHIGKSSLGKDIGQDSSPRPNTPSPFPPLFHPPTTWQKLTCSTGHWAVPMCFPAHLGHYVCSFYWC